MSYTAQQIFDIVAVHLMQQGETARDKGSCKYRCESSHQHKTLKCAVGALMPDSMYNPEIEGQSADDLFDTLEGFESLIDRKHSSMLVELQSIHDYVVPSMWERALRRYAHKTRLSMAALDKYTSEASYEL